MRVKVTEEHIEAGSKYDSYRCPVALAIREELALVDGEVGVFDVCVNINTIVLYERLIFPTPESVMEFTLSLDSGLPVKPFEFEINYPGGGQVDEG